MATEVDEIGGDVVMSPLKLMRFEGCRDVATKVDDVGVDVVMWPLKMM